MNKLLLTTAIATILSVGAAPALAADNADQTDINQVLLDLQTALNSINIDHSGTDVSQTAVNAGNLINLEEDLDDVFQITWADQVAMNYAFTQFGAWEKFDQAATNVANSLNLPTDDAEDVTQIATGFADQFAQNMAIYEASSSKVTQDATNAVNLITIDDVDNMVDQYVSPGTFQTAMNFLVGGNSFSQLNKVTQTATNVANIVDAGELDVVYQDAGNAQLAANLLDFGNGGLSSEHDLHKSEQAATNAANVVTVEDLNTKIDQDSWGNQTALNTALYVGYAGWFGYGAGDGTVVDFDQTATNVANLITVSGSLPDVNGLTEIDQFSSTTQFASNVLSGMGDLNDVVQSATNVANSIGVATGS